jgi:cobalt-zinc-cadmium efflux system membrane fusion protein
MSESDHRPGEEPARPNSIEGRAWSARAQWRAAGILTLLSLGVILGVWSVSRLFAPHTSQAAAPSPPGTYRATAQQLKTFTIETVQAHSFVSEELTDGKIGINADRATPVISPYSGRVTRVIAGLGEAVKAGAPLATVEASEFVQAQNDLRVASAQVKLARTNETRKHALYDAKGGSLQDWQQSQADLAAAETALDLGRNRLQIFGKSAGDINALQASVSMNPVATLTAPIAGVVVDRQVGPGQYLQAGGNPVFTIADPSSVWLLANVRESDAGQVQVGQAVEVHVLAYPKRVFNARVTYVAAVLDPVTHRLPVRASIDNVDGSLKPEMFASFRILTSEATESASVPEAAVIYEGDAAHVWVVTADGLLTYRSIQAGRISDGLVEVIDGLKAGEKVVTKGGLFIDQAAAPGIS